jgi:hypothetical protein
VKIDTVQPLEKLLSALVYAQHDHTDPSESAQVMKVIYEDRFSRAPDRPQARRLYRRERLFPDAGRVLESRAIRNENSRLLENQRACSRVRLETSRFKTRQQKTKFCAACPVRFHPGRRLFTDLFGASTDPGRLNERRKSLLWVG